VWQIRLQREEEFATDETQPGLQPESKQKEHYFPLISTNQNSAGGDVILALISGN
jgi:hypothetical protein